MAAAKNYQLAIVGRRAEALEAVASECLAAGSPAVKTYVADVNDAEATTRVVSSVMKELGAMDGVILNAGVNRPGKVEDTTADDFDAVIGVNLRGVYLYLRETIPHLRAAGKGQIVVTSSIMGERCSAGAALYCASKWGVQGLVGSVRKELSGLPGVKIGTVMPGSIATAWWDEAGRGGKRDTVPDKSKMLAPEVVAGSILSLVEQHESSDIEKIVLDPCS
jgi:NADP-dependent 3-hydroxy acid dehydrogenase YdfG